MSGGRKPHTRETKLNKTVQEKKTKFAEEAMRSSARRNRYTDDTAERYATSLDERKKN